MVRPSHVLIAAIILAVSGCAPALPVTPTRAPTATPIQPAQSPWVLSTLATLPGPAPSATNVPPTAVPTQSATRQPVTAQPQPATAAPATSAPTSGSSGGVDASRIDSFTASTDRVKPGDTITLTWKTNADRVSIRVALASGQYRMWYEQPGEGSMAYTVPLTERNPFYIHLVIGSVGNETYEQVSFSIICPDQWFVDNPPDTCPEPAASGDGAIQRFEHGSMVWASGSNTILILRDGSYWNRRDNTWDSTMPESDPSLTPPAGLFQPVRGFGKVWRESNLLEELGWALAPEVSALVTYQCDTLYKRSVCLLRIPDGVLKLGLWGGWGPYTGP